MKKVLLAMSCLVAFDAVAQSTGKTDLMYAAEYNDLYTLDYYLKAGANANTTDADGNTAYCYAYYRKNLNAAKSLEKYGADTSRKCNINGAKFSTASLSTPYYNNSPEAKRIGQRSRVSYRSGFWGASKPYLYAGLGVAGIAAAAGGGGGGGGEGGFTKPATSTDVDPTAFETAEFYGNAASQGLSEGSDSEFLDIINAQYAYARGYDGTGVTIAVLDTGIDTDHLEFDTNLNADLTNTDFQSGDNDPNHGANHPHGTNVAGIAAGDKDGTGMHGVAYGSKVIGYRIGVDGVPLGIRLNYTDDAINDAVAKGATVFNLSYGTDADAATNASSTSKDDLEARYTGFFDGNDATNTAQMDTFINSVTTNEAVIVRAAGNDGYSQPGIQNALPLHYTEFDGHFITAVALNEAGNGIASFSNRCGVAKNYCLAAPGTDLMTATDGGGYTLASGTSFAAPTVAGAVAVVQDAFGLSADRTTNILFQTATDMGAAGVDDVYGHGLLNLDLATAPGAELITSVSSTSSFAYSSTSLTTSSAFATLQAPTFVIEDELYRTFKVDGNTLKTDKEEKVDLQEREKTFAKEKKLVSKTMENGLRTSFVMSNEQTADALDTFDYMSLTGNMKGFDVSFGFTNAPGQELNDIVRSVNLIQEDALANPYMGLAEKGFVASTKYDFSEDLTFQTNVFFGEIEDSDNNNMGKSTSALAKLIYNYSDDSVFSLESGFLNEKETVLGSKFEGAFALADDTYTYFTGLTAKTALTSKVNLFANAYIGVTKAGTTGNSLVTDVSDIVSHSAAIGGEYNFTKKQSAGLILSQPLKVSNGDIGYSYLSGGNIDKGYRYSNDTQSLSPSATQFDIQAFYKQEFEKGDKLNVGVLHSVNADSIKGEEDTSVLVKYRSKF
tara:strand:+ start:623 stop:3307 length:2685 start_codon:yes stop_codon:yes gene_type:complete